MCRCFLKFKRRFESSGNIEGRCKGVCRGATPLLSAKIIVRQKYGRERRMKMRIHCKDRKNPAKSRSGERKNYMKEYRVAVLGATGAVGQEMIGILEEYGFPVKELVPLASARSAGKKIKFRGEDVIIREAVPEVFKGMDIVLGAAENNIAKEFAPHIVKAGAVFVDNSSAFRMDKEVPLVVPEINGEDVKNHHGIIANPNCSTIITLMAVAPIARLSPIKKMVASTYQAVSGAGVGGIRELEEQVRSYVKGEDGSCGTFPYPIAFNLIPCIGGTGDNLYTSEEMKMQNEGRKILHLPELLVSCTCVRVPILRSHSISATVITERKVTVEEARTAIAGSAGVRLMDDTANGIYPMPMHSTGGDTVYVGRIREDLTDEKGLNIFCCGDQVRKGAAANAVQIAQLLI